MKQTFVDLFAGIGGFHFAATAHRMEGAMAAEIDPAAALQYERATGLHPEEDVCELDAQSIPDHDLLLAGFPCQPYSIIGNRLGLQDRRGAIVSEVFRILAEKKPSACVLENVRQLLTHGGGATVEFIRKTLSEIGYTVHLRVLNALDFGLPQKRERLFIVGFRSPAAAEGFAWPDPDPERTPLDTVLEDDDSIPPRYWLSPAIRSKVARLHSTELRPSIWHQNKGGNVSSHPFSCALRANASYNYLMVNGERRLTEREMLRLQGFPESFPIVGGYSQMRKQCGNAVPVPVASAVVGEVLRALN